MKDRTHGEAREGEVEVRNGLQQRCTMAPTLFFNHIGIAGDVSR